MTSALAISCQRRVLYVLRFTNACTTLRADLRPPVNQTRKEALEHYKSKGAFVKKNLEVLQATIEKKQENCQAVVQLMMQKQQQAQRQGA